MILLRKGKFKVETTSLPDLRKAKLVRNSVKNREDLKYFDELILRIKKR